MRAIKIKTINIVILFFSLFLTLAVFSQINAATKPKPTYDVGFNKADWLYYKSSNDLTAYLGKKTSSLPTVRYQKGGDYLEFSLNNVSSTTSVSLETNTKTPNTPTLFYRNAFNDTDVTYQITNIPFKVKEEIVLKNPPTVPGRSYGGSAFGGKSTTFTFSAETTGKPVKQKDGSIAFFDNQNNYLFQLDKPFMIDAKGIISNDVDIEITKRLPMSFGGTNKTKIASEETIFGDSNLEQKSGLPSITNQYNGAKSFVNNLKNSFVNIKKVLDLGGIEPPESWIASQTPHQARPRTELFYHKENFNQNRHRLSVLETQQYTITLSADSNWLSAATYPVIIDPTVTHTTDIQFNGQYNRVADSDSSINSTQLESSYPEATKDPYTVLLLHFNEANGTTAGIRDYASTTRVITANGNASTTSYVTKLGLGNSAAFDGTGDYVSIPDSDDWDFGTGDFTIDTWTRLAVNPANNNGMILVDNGGLASGVRLDYAQLESVFNLRVFVAGTGQDTVRTLNLNQWYHISLVRTSGTVKLFLDGVQINTSFSASGDITGLTAGVRVGNTISDTQHFNGYLDELRILKGRALTTEEIKAVASRRPYAVYTSPVIDATASVAWNTLNWTEGGVNTGDGEQPYSTNSLVAQWDFNETSGTTLTASSSGSCTTACNGTLTNFAYTASQDQATTTTGWTANNKKWGAGGLMISGTATADLVSIADPASNVLDPNSADLTIETWVKTSDVSAEILSNNNANGAACTNNGYYLGIDSSGYPVFYLDTNGATAGCDAAITGSAKINDGFWHFLSISVTRGTSAIMYLDGVQIGSDTSVTSYSAITVTGNAYFGGSAGGLDAILDSSRYYSRALSASEILSNYNAGNIEIQTRTGASSDPNDGTWEAWKPTTGETQLFSLDSDAVNWHSDIMASTTIATSTETVIKAEGTGSLKIRTGMASTTTGTVALWHMEETGTTTGTTLYDSTSNAKNGTTNGTPTVINGIFGKARSFDGVDDYVNIGSSVMSVTDNFTISAWINVLNTTAAERGYGIAVYNGGINTGYGIGFYLGHLSGLYSGVDWPTFNTTVDPPANTWTHIALVRRNGTTEGWMNGVQYQTSNPTAVPIAPSNSSLIGYANAASGSGYFKGLIDEVFLLNRALSPDEIAETYRMGANHHFTRQVSAVDLSAQTKLAFWIAADRPGTGLEAMLGESDYANYEMSSSTATLSTNTVLYIKGDEIASSTSIKDSSFSGKAITANGNARTAGGGKIGNSVYFDGTGDYLSVPASTDFVFGTGDFTIDGWVRMAAYPPGYSTIFSNIASWSATAFNFRITPDGNLRFSTGLADLLVSSNTVPLTTWTHIAVVRASGTLQLFINSVSGGTIADSSNFSEQNTVYLGALPLSGGGELNGNLDELSVVKGTALTPDQIRQAYEYGLRTHPITIDFGATLQSSDLISSATDYSFSLTATTSGLSATTSGLYLGDKIIIKENLGGTEYTAQGTVNSINATTGAITVPSWDTGSTFPASNGYSPNATVFKWQREYFDITGSLSTHRDAITNLTLRPTNGAEGRTIYLDDFRYNTNYLTASSSSAITSSNGRYLQYRAILTSTDTFVSPFLTAFNTLYTSLAQMFPPLIGVSGGGFLSF